MATKKHTSVFYFCHYIFAMRQRQSFIKASFLEPKIFDYLHTCLVLAKGSSKNQAPKTMFHERRIIYDKRRNETKS